MSEQIIPRKSLSPRTPSGKKYIRPSVILLMSFKNLFFKKLRTSLTILGVVIGIGAIVFLVSLGLGLQRVVSQQVIGSQSVKAIDVNSSKPRLIRINDEAISKFGKLGHVESVAKTFSFPGKSSFKGATIDTVIYGSDEAYLELGSFKVSAGRNKIENESEIIINNTLLSTLGIKDAEKALKQQITIIVPAESTADQLKSDFRRELTIVGVVDNGSSAEVTTSDKVFIQAGMTSYSQAKVITDNKDAVPAVRKQLEALGFTTTSPIDTLDQINQVFTLLNLLLAGFGGIGMVIAVLGMFNTLTISLLERTKEIGLLVSLGARKRDIRRLFLIEALALSLIGAVLGLILAWVTGASINAFLATLAKSKGVENLFTIFYIPFWLVAAVLLFTVIIGLMVVTFPARRASRVNPIDALRHE
jgi:putative ABC transport system permease protein